MADVVEVMASDGAVMELCKWLGYKWNDEDDMDPGDIDRFFGAAEVTKKMFAVGVAALNEAGYVVVPREPTEAQIETMGQMLGSGDTYKTNEDWPHARAAYRAAMLSAAQPAPK